MTRTPIVVLAASFAGCAGSYVYRPVAATATVAGYPAARYRLPPEEPEGEVDVASFGFTDMTLGEDDERTRFLHARLEVTNRDGVAPWTVDTREQRLYLPEEGMSPPAFANSDEPTLPIVRIEPGRKHIIDLYWALPEDMQKAKHVPEFDVLWRLRTARREVTGRTTFERERLEEEEEGYSGPYAGWGPIWWYDPLIFPATSFVHPAVIRRNARFARAGHLPPARVYAPSHPGFIAPRPAFSRSPSFAGRGR